MIIPTDAQLARLPAMSASGGVAAGPPATVERRSAGDSGTLYNWRPRRLSAAMMTRSREKIVERAIDLEQNDPHVSGLIEGMNLNVVGTGYLAQANIKGDVVPMSAEDVKLMQLAQEWEWQQWCTNCDIRGRLHFQDILSVSDRSTLVRGEYLLVARMVKNSGRHSLKLQIVDPLRIKTPSDKYRGERFIDGIEIDGVGRPVAAWVHNNPTRPFSLESSNFKRIRFNRGHRQQVFHGFTARDPDQYRGQVFFSAAIKFFRDLSDLLDAEVVTNIVTSSVAMFIQAQDPTAAALAAAGGSGGTVSNPNSTRPDIEETSPGGVYYGRPGEEPKLLQADRPGNNFVPFVDTVLRAASSCAGIPLEVALKRYGDMSYSSARAALLDAWRVFTFRQDMHMRHLCSPVWAMIQEESGLRGYLEMPEFYDHMAAYTRVKWIAPGRGQLEPVKETQSNILKLKYNMTTQTDIAAEAGKDWESEIAQTRQREKEIESLHGLDYPDANKTGAAKENAK